MRKVYFNDLPAYQFHLLQKFSGQVKHAVFSRHGGCSGKPFDALNVRFGIGDLQENVIKNRRKICGALDIDCDRLVSANQTHGRNVVVADDSVLEKLGACFRAKTAEKNKGLMEIDNTDALVTKLKGVGLMIQVADCQAILMFDPVRGVAAAVHAGWKGLARDVSGAAIQVMREKFGTDPANVLAGIAPSLGPCCAFFSNPETELPASFQKFTDRKKRVDLWSFSIEQLQKHGIKKGNIECAKICTQCGNGKEISGPHNFFSYRGEHGITGRFGAIIALN